MREPAFESLDGIGRSALLRPEDSSRSGRTSERVPNIRQDPHPNAPPSPSHGLRHADVVHRCEIAADQRTGRIPGRPVDVDAERPQRSEPAIDGAASADRQHDFRRDIDEPLACRIEQLTDTRRAGALGVAIRPGESPEPRGFRQFHDRKIASASNTKSSRHAPAIGSWSGNLHLEHFEIGNRRRQHVERSLTAVRERDLPNDGIRHRLVHPGGDPFGSAASVRGLLQGVGTHENAAGSGDDGPREGNRTSSSIYTAGLDPGSLRGLPHPMEAFIQNFLGTYGWIAMIVLLLASGVGIPIGEEVVNVPAGIFVGRGEMEPTSTFVAAYLGVLGGDFLWFWICSRFGTRLLHYRGFRRFVHPRRLLQAKHQFDRRGASVLMIARFIPGTRSPALTIAALMHMPWRKFIAVELVCCALTTPLQVGLGILIGRGLAGQSLPTVVFSALGIVAGIIALTALVNWWVASRRKDSGPAPRARIAWLRRARVQSTSS